MLVTISGMVGSGKTTAAARVSELLQQQHGIEVESWRFQALPIFRRQPTSEAPSSSANAERAERWPGYKRKRLTARIALGQMLRALAFRVYRWTRRSGRHQVCSRYFYDSFVHYALSTRRELLYAELIRRCIPRPDLALLMVASPDTIRSRRSRYSEAYLTHVWQAYQALPQTFPHLVIISTDPDNNAADAIEHEVLKWMQHSRFRP
jgi:thymidylate kinase